MNKAIAASNTSEQRASSSVVEKQWYLPWEDMITPEKPAQDAMLKIGDPAIE
jgi:hypothetical protein